MKGGAEPGHAGVAENGAPPVSVIVPARDAEATLGAALDAVLAQDYAGAVEIVVADGSEGGATAALVGRRYPGVRLVRNPARTAPAGLNVALRVARHGIVARCDAHCAWPPGYLSRAVETLGRTGAVNVGGVQRPVGRTRFERAAALAMSSWLGTGGAVHRVGGAEGAADTVYLGVFRRSALEAAGGFDESLARNQDYELNWRLREMGGTVWFDPALVVAYRPRGSVRALARQYFQYGRWKRAVVRRHPRSWRARQMAAPLLVLGLGASAALALGAAPFALAGRDGAVAALWAASAAPLAWALALLGGSVAVGLSRRRAEAVLLPAVAATMHLAWGAGFLAGVRGDG